MTIGNVDRKLSKENAQRAEPIVFSRRGRGGSANCCSFCRIASSCGGVKTDASSGGNTSAMIRCAALTFWLFAHLAPFYYGAATFAEARQKKNAGIDDSPGQVTSQSTNKHRLNLQIVCGRDFEVYM